MRYIILFIFLFTSAIHAQEGDTIQSPVMKAYNDFVNYTPKALEGQPVPERFGQLKADNLITLRLCYGEYESLNLKAEEIQWMKERVIALAAAFYLEGNPVLLRSKGGYSGCPESNYILKKEMLNGKEVTIVNFCHGCKEWPTHEDEFIDIFNNRTRKLLAAGR